ncbi:MAG TPA: DUF4157 domain-containing protein [Algoriphagus sp.]|nr:DUF4157 domain-containing protein [Algoriphagus sp.]
MQFQDNRPESVLQRKLGEIANSKAASGQRNNTGLPDSLKSGIEGLSGYSLDDVRVHYNSAQPAQLQAHAFAQGSEIHLGPGQEKHLPHEAWHVVQQKQGRVKPTIQMKSGVNVNDDSGLEREADIMGGKALQMKIDSSQDQESMKTVTASLDVTQLTKLKIGISGDSNPVGINADTLPDFTYVWILSNKKGEPDDLDNKGVVPGQNKSTPNQIVAANAEAVGNPIYYQVGGYQKGYHMKGIFQSGQFIVPRGGDKSGIDYSFLRFAAIEAYKLWYDQNGRWKQWPNISSDETNVETIDSDVSGITTDSGKALNDNKKAEGNWLAEAGVYKWNWQDVKGDDLINAKFKDVENNINVQKRDETLKQFVDAYFDAEMSKRDEASGDILQIYFPEPATRLSSYAIDLLSESGFQNMKITRGNQLGFGRESIGLIAGLIYLDQKKTKKDDENRSIGKLKYNSGFVVPTDLGKRKGAFVSLFLNWCIKTENGANAAGASDFEGLHGVSEFDQSYLNPGLPGQIKRWHRSTLVEMKKPAPGKDSEAFFHPKS